MSGTVRQKSICSNRRWWLLAIVTALISGAGFYVLNLQYINYLADINSEKIYYVLEKSLEAPGELLSKPLTRGRDFWVKKSEKFFSEADKHDLKIDNFLLIGLEENKSRILLSADTSNIWKAFDLSAEMQQAAARPGSYVSFVPDFEEYNFLELISVFPEIQPPAASLIIFKITTRELLFINFFGAVLVLLIPALIILFGHYQKKKAVENESRKIDEIEEIFEEFKLARVREYFGETSTVTTAIEKYLNKIDSLQEEMLNLKQSLKIQIKNLVNQALPILQGNYHIQLDVPPGPLTPFADLINSLVKELRKLPEINKTGEETKEETEKKIESVETEETVQAAKKEVSAVVSSPADYGDDLWTQVLANNDEYLDHLSGQLSLVTKIIPPLFNRLEELYEVELNEKLKSGGNYSGQTLSLLESLISEKNTTMETLDRIQMIVNELVMLRNWVSHKMSKSGQN
jgi:hypothetical protein